MDVTLQLSTAELLYQRAHQMGLRTTWLKQGGLFAVHVAGKERYINFACSSLNSHASISLAQNKYLTRLILERHRLPNIPFAHPANHAEAEAFLAVHKKIIAKPLSGMGSCDINIVSTVAELEALAIEGYILEKYIIGREMRYLVLNEAVIAVHLRDAGDSVKQSRSVHRTSYPMSTWDADSVAMSLQIARILGLAFAAIDYLIDDTGKIYILEVNTKPAISYFHTPNIGPMVDAAGLFLEAAVEAYDATNSGSIVTYRQD